MAKGDVILANQHAGIVVLPRVYTDTTGSMSEMKTRLGRVSIPPHGTYLMGAEEWAIRGQNKMIQRYLEIGHLALIKKDKPVDLVSDQTSELEVPEHLQAEEVIEPSKTGSGAVAAGVRKDKTRKGEITIG